VARSTHLGRGSGPAGDGDGHRVPGERPDFLLRLPGTNGIDRARGVLLNQVGTNDSRKFRILAGSPARDHEMPSFARHFGATTLAREAMRQSGLLRPSERWPGWLEAAEDIDCGSPSFAAGVLVGAPRNGWIEWKTEAGAPLSDFMEGVWSGPARSWLVRGSNVAGADLVQNLWLPEGRVSLAAPRLRQGIGQGISKERLRSVVEEDWGSTATYNQKLELVEELHAFLSRMKPGDTVCTLSGGRFYVGEITGPAEQTPSDNGRSNLRRPVEWQSTWHPYDTLPEEIQQRLSIQHDIVDLTTVQPVIEGLGRSDEELADEAGTTAHDPGGSTPALTARRELELPVPDQHLADRLLVHEVAWLREIRDLLWEEKQIILYGPPGTGKTYTALHLAEHLGGGPEQVKLVQFHPSYTYEDFFEGFRPRENPETGEVAFRLTAGPLRELADLASREGNHHIPHFLIIDEINRANLAKVFGELYFLLEYRRKTVRLTYSGDDFALPPNLFVIGTMNTADRSIALVDAAMRRRFAFVELSPRAEPTSGMLRRWLDREGHDGHAADLLDALNSRIDDPDFRIGPSYLMKPGVYRAGGLERTWRTKILPLLEEHHYGESFDIERRYGIDALSRPLGEGGADEPAP
jgi:5-methylcytosine-specific restriction enzyme B